MPARALKTGDDKTPLPQLTPKEEQLVKELARGSALKQAASLAGYSPKTDLTEVLKRPPVRAALKSALSARMASVQGEAIDTLIRLARKRKPTVGDRVAREAARDLLDLGGMFEAESTGVAGGVVVNITIGEDKASIAVGGGPKPRD